MDYRRVYGGTRVGTDSICKTCSYGRIMKGYSMNERIYICDRYFEPIRVPFKVAECSDYLDKRLPDVEDMKKMAYILQERRTGHQTGFVRLSELRELEEDES